MLWTTLKFSAYALWNYLLWQNERIGKSLISQNLFRVVILPFRPLLLEMSREIQKLYWLSQKFMRASYDFPFYGS